MSGLTSSLNKIVKIRSNLRDARWVAGIGEYTHFILAKVSGIVRTEVVALVRLDNLSLLI